MAHLPRIVIWNPNNYKSFSDALESGAVYESPVASEGLNQYLSDGSTTALEDALSVFEDSMKAVNNSDYVFEVEYSEGETITVDEIINVYSFIKCDLGHLR